MSRADQKPVYLVDAHHNRHGTAKLLNIYAKANGDPDAVLLRITYPVPARPGDPKPSPSMDTVLDKEGARAVFNWLGVWLMKDG